MGIEIKNMDVRDYDSMTPDMNTSDSDSNEEPDIHSPGHGDQSIQPYQFEPFFQDNRQQVEKNTSRNNSQTQSRKSCLVSMWPLS